MRVKLDSDYEYWKQLREDPERYNAEKEQIADNVITLLDRRFPGLAAQVEMSDVATPMTVGTLYRQLAGHSRRMVSNDKYLWHANE